MLSQRKKSSKKKASKTPQRKKSSKKRASKTPHRKKSSKKKNKQSSNYFPIVPLTPRRHRHDKLRNRRYATDDEIRHLRTRPYRELKQINGLMGAVKDPNLSKKDTVWSICQSPKYKKYCLLFKMAASAGLGALVTLLGTSIPKKTLLGTVHPKTKKPAIILQAGRHTWRDIKFELKHDVMVRRADTKDWPGSKYWELVVQKDDFYTWQRTIKDSSGFGTLRDGYYEKGDFNIVNQIPGELLEIEGYLPPENMINRVGEHDGKYTKYRIDRKINNNWVSIHWLESYEPGIIPKNHQMSIIPFAVFTKDNSNLIRQFNKCEITTKLYTQNITTDIDHEQQAVIFKNIKPENMYATVFNNTKVTDIIKKCMSGSQDKQNTIDGLSQLWKMYSKIQQANN
jgi:hypothetical protein